MEIIVRKKNIVMDATILTGLMSCACYTDLRFNRNFVSIHGKGNSLECGSIVHKYLEVFYKSRIGGLNLEDSHGIGYAAAQLYIAGCQHCTNFESTPEKPKPQCGHPVNEYPGVKNTPMEPPPDKPYVIGWRWVLESIDAYHKFWRNDSWVPLEIEVVKSKVLYEDDEIRILWKAKLDATFDTDQGIRAVDHKSMKQNRTVSKLNNQFIGQNLIMGTRTMFRNNFGFQKTLPPEKRFMRNGMSYSVDQLHEWQSQTLPFYGRMLLAYNEMGYWPKNFTNCQSKYGDCSYIEVCEADHGMRETVLRNGFIIGPDWNPVNETSEED